MAFKEGSKQETHVLMVTLSSQGHINPMLRLGKRLVEKGLHVTLATTEFGGQRMLKASAISSTTGINFISGIRLLFFPDGFRLDYDRSNNLDHYMEYLAKIGPVKLSNLIKEYYHDTDKKLSCIISNPFVSWVVDAALENRVPCAMLWIQPCSLYAIYYSFYNKLNPFPTLTNPDMGLELPGLPLLHSHDLPSFVLPTNPFRSFPRLLSDMFQNMKRHKWVLANSFFELEKEVIDSMAELCPIRPVGPLVPPSLLGEDQSLDAGIEMWKPDETSLEWLNNQQPASVLYVSFGSIIALPVKLMEAIATALKNTNHPFLWVVKRPEFPSADGAGELPIGFEEETKNQGLIVPWSPQTKVLAHPSIACFMTHCGWNSMLETLAAGVPVIAYPQWTDQPTNAKLIVDGLKVGLRLQPGADGLISNKDVEDCIKQILRGPKSEEFQKNAAVLKQAAREAMATGGSSDRNIELLVNEIVGSS
ncbi:UDP-glycosyltransferase 84B1-like [Herrania umbratica]|uniref:Glycosyltransferase n=1 Tax=Herrania umbratica TaxID=108875 RepID=A0A6J1AXU1_9ROSI|nr:UDP-glycosyltransferase 84B1-like [Herrania umbratica]